MIESDSLISKGSRHLVREVGAERKEAQGNGNGYTLAIQTAYLFDII